MSPEVRSEAEQNPASAVSVWETFARALSPIEYRPKLVDRVEAVHQVTRTGSPYVVIRSPIAQSYLKLDPREYDLLALMDGTKTVKSLVVEYYQRHGVLALPRIAGLVRLLRANHFLTDPPLDVFTVLGTRLRGVDAGSVIVRLLRGFQSTTFGIKNVDGVFEGWYRTWAKIFFTKPMFFLGLIFALAGPVFFMIELSQGRYDVFKTGGSYLTGFLLIAVLEVVALIIHEVGHAMAVKHAGRHVWHAGLMIYYGAPAGYVETTDIWMAPRRKRLITSLAGPWTGLILGGICAIAAFLLPEGPVGRFVFAWGFVFLLNNLMNFNPLLELDGYYLLVDLIEKPMLRAKALSFVRGALWGKLRHREKLTGEERFFAFFGFASVAWTAFSIALTVQFWQMRLLPFIRETWETGGLLGQIILLFLGTTVLIPILLAARALGLRGYKWLAGRFASTRQHLTSRHYREALAALRATSLWSGLPEARLLEVARLMRAEEIAGGKEVVRQGEQGDRFYLIDRGRFEVLVDEKPVALLESGDYFGERALLNDAPRAATVIALSPALVFSLDREAFNATLAHDLATKTRLDAALAYRVDVEDIPLFRDLSPTEFDLLLSRLVPITVEPGQKIIKQGEPGDLFYVIKSGQVEVERDGRILATLARGEAFGEIALLMNVPRTATIRALETTELLALNEADFRELLAGYCGRTGTLETLSHQRLLEHSQIE